MEAGLLLWRRLASRAGTNNHDSASEYAAAVDDEAAGLAVKLQAAVQVGDGGTSPERSSLEQARN